MPVIHLTSFFARKALCPAGSKKIEYFDSKARGLLLEVRISGGRTYYQRYTDVRGRERQVKIGSAEVLTLSQAKRKGREIVAQSLLGEDPQSEKDRLRSIPTVATFVRDSYLPHIKSYKRSWKTDETILRLHILPRIGRLHLDEVLPAHVNDITRCLRDRSYSQGTAGRVLVILRFLFNLARKWKIPRIEENPTAAFTVPPDVERTRFLTEDETARLIEAIKSDDNTTAANAILLLLLTGARRNEITHAEWEHVDWENGTLLVPLSKSGKPRIISLSTSAQALLTSIDKVKDSPYIFPSPMTSRPSASIYFPWDRIRKRAQLNDLRLHDLRHSFASFLVNSGEDLYVVQKLLGHAHARSTQRYAHLQQQRLSNAAEVVAKIVDAAKKKGE